jgi:GTP cyclohydrolase FolE2
LGIFCHLAKVSSESDHLQQAQSTAHKQRKPSHVKMVYFENSTEKIMIHDIAGIQATEYSSKLYSTICRSNANQQSRVFDRDIDPTKAYHPHPPNKPCNSFL